MTLDSEQDRQLLIEMLGRSQITGAMAPTVTRMLAKLQTASIEEGAPSVNANGEGRAPDRAYLYPNERESVKQGKEKT